MTIFVYFQNINREIIEICSVSNFYLCGNYLYYVLSDCDFYQLYINITGYSFIKVCVGGKLQRIIHN